MENLKSPFKEIIPNFIKYKKSLGYKYDNTYFLNIIDNITYKNNMFDLNNPNIILELFNSKDEYKEYLTIVRELLEFNYLLKNNKPIKLLNYKNYKKPSKKLPFIINEIQINMFLEYVDAYSKTLNYPLNYVYPTIYRLLYSTGIRINEALNIKEKDIDLDKSLINIIDGKGEKSRTIFISNSMKLVLKKYIELTTINEYLFEYKNQKIKYSLISENLKYILKNFDFKFRLHDFRHSFATNVFKNLRAEGISEEIILYYLHLYLGHSTLEETVYYLEFNTVIKEVKNAK